MGRRKKFSSLEEEIQSIDEDILKLEQEITTLKNEKIEILKKKEQMELNNFIHYIEQKNITISDALLLLKEGIEK